MRRSLLAVLLLAVSPTFAPPPKPARHATAKGSPQSVCALPIRIPHAIAPVGVGIGTFRFPKAKKGNFIGQIYMRGLAQPTQVPLMYSSAEVYGSGYLVISCKEIHPVRLILGKRKVR